MKINNETYDTSCLPRWARKTESLVYLWHSNLAWRCDINRAQTKDYQRFLKREGARVYSFRKVNYCK